MKRLLPLLALLLSVVAWPQTPGNRTEISIQSTSCDTLYHGRYPSGLAPSADGSTISTSGCLRDGSGNQWTVVAGVVDKNGSPYGVSSGVTTLLIFGGKLYQFNGTSWFGDNGSGWGAAQADPRGGGGGGGGGGGNGFGVKVVGNTFTDLNGNVLQFQGTNITGLEINYAPAMWDGYYNTTLAQWVAIKNLWQMNVIRLPINEWAWDTNALSAGGIRYQTIYKTAVNNILAAGMYVIIDLHWAAPNGYTGSLTGHNSAGYADGQPGYIDSDNGPAFWTAIANTYKNNPAVIFELFNEPLANGTGSPWNATQMQILKDNSAAATTLFTDMAQGKTTTTTGVTFTPAGHQQLVNAIRATGATNVILWSTTVLDSYPAQSLTVRPSDTSAPAGFVGTWASQLGATVHYANGVNTDYSNILNAGFPILITEFYNLTGRGGYTWAQTNHIGYVMWGADNWDGSATSNLATGSPGPALATQGSTAGNGSGAPWNFHTTGTGNTGAAVAWPLITPPAPAAAVGFNTRTFSSTSWNATAGPWYSYNYFGNTEPANSIVQNSDGSLDLGHAVSNNYGVATSHQNNAKPNKWEGIRFGGGGYFELTTTMTAATGFPNGSQPTAAWWANDENETGGYTPCFIRWMEVDDFETNVNSQAKEGQAVHDWSNAACNGGGGGNVNTQPSIGSPVTLPGGGLLTGTHKYAWRWVPATASTQGSIGFYIDGAQVGSACVYNQYSSATIPATGSNICNIIDQRHMSLIIGGITNTWQHVTAVNVWQSSSAGNLVQ